ncbi:MAG TPA: alpha/beta hydrolase [Moraxellaceae bacterium]|nr:alpha/beta hydrolase [Moraxellaceae bacterium]
MQLIRTVLLSLLMAWPALSSAYDKALAEEMLQSQEGIAGLKRHEVAVDGQRISYLDNERDKAPRTVMLVHGFGDSSASWMYMARLFRDAGYRILVPDLPGFGRSSRNRDADYGYVAQGNRLFQMLDLLKVGNVHLVGNSMGGGVVGEMALLQPARVASLTLIDAAGVHTRATDLDREVLKGSNFLIPKVPEDLPRLLDFAMAKRPIVPQPIVDLMAERAVADNALHSRIFYQVLMPDVGFLTLHLADIKAPTLVIWGDKDRLLDLENGKVFQRYIPDARLVVLPGIGHMPMTEAPEETGIDILHFIDEVSAKGTAVAGK